MGRARNGVQALCFWAYQFGGKYSKDLTLSPKRLNYAVNGTVTNSADVPAEDVLLRAKAKALDVIWGRHLKPSPV